MSPIQFTLNQLLLAAQYKPEVVMDASEKVNARREELKKEILHFLKTNDGANALQVAEHFNKSQYSIRDRLQELAREEKVILCMQAHNKPAIYKVKR